MEGLDALKRMDLCLYGGSVMPDEVGNKLVKGGVRLVGHIGSTEMGQVSVSGVGYSQRVCSLLIRLCWGCLSKKLMTSFRDFETDKEWNYFRTLGPKAIKNINSFLVFEERDGEGSGTRYEMVVKNGWPAMVGCYLSNFG